MRSRARWRRPGSRARSCPTCRSRKQEPCARTSPARTTGPARAAAIAREARGFLYYVSVTGVTGARAELPPDLAARLRELRALSPVPVAVGFGISRPEQAAALRGLSDGIVVGSALVAAHHQGGVRAAAELVRGLRAALS